MIITIDYSLPLALYEAKFSVIGSASRKAAIAITEALLTCLHELAIIAVESIQERLGFVQEAIMTSHYDDLPPLQAWDECGLVLAGCTAIMGAERSWSEGRLLTGTRVVGLLCAGKAKAGKKTGKVRGERRRSRMQKTMEKQGLPECLT